VYLEALKKNYMAATKDLQFLENKLEYFNKKNTVLKYRLNEMVDNDAENNFCKWQNIFKMSFF